VTLALGFAAFGGGVWLLVESVENLVGTVRRWAAAAGLSAIALSALVLGFDLESTVAGSAAALDGLEGTALGTSIGAAIFLSTVGLGAAALTAPFAIRSPTRMLVAPALAALIAIALVLDGELSRLDGALLLASFGPLLVLVISARRVGVPIETSDARPDRLVLRLGAALAGLVIGAELLVFGTERIVGEIGISETVFGLIVVGIAVSLEELVLEMLPAHRGFPELSVGNVLGTLVFLLTASLGVIALVRPVAVPDSVRDYHAPALAVAVALALALLLRGRLGRKEGVLLCFAYAAYVGGALIV
jgi:cation:H+ antiporter